MKPRHDFLWVTDPWHTVEIPKDTTPRLMEETLAQGFECHWCDVRSIRFDPDGVKVDALPLLEVTSSRKFVFGRPVTLPPAAFRSIQYRTDPPVDLAYLHPLQFLAMGIEGTRTRIVNPPEILLSGNEKLEASLMPKGFAPPSVAACDAEALLTFGAREKRAILKPLHNAQSKGVELLDFSSKDAIAKARSKLKKATEGFTRPVLLQRYLKGILQGEQRLWFLDGKLLASVRKLPKQGEFRIDMDRGGSLAKSALNAKESKAARAIGAHLKKRGIRLAAVDLIDGLVTDFNFTSPGLLLPMEQLLGENLARPIIRALAQ